MCTVYIDYTHNITFFTHKIRYKWKHVLQTLNMRLRISYYLYLKLISKIDINVCIFIDIALYFTALLAAIFSSEHLSHLVDRFH